MAKSMAKQYCKFYRKFSPTVYLIQNILSLCLSILQFKVVNHPLNKVIFEHAFDELMKKVWGDEFVDVGIGKMFSEWLREQG
jgi:hypothetical protein